VMVHFQCWTVSTERFSVALIGVGHSPTEKLAVL